eukprot:gene37861-13754_t
MAVRSLGGWKYESDSGMERAWEQRIGAERFTVSARVPLSDEEIMDAIQAYGPAAVKPVPKMVILKPAPKQTKLSAFFK